jgi:hypothetical protein
MPGIHAITINQKYQISVGKYQPFLGLPFLVKEFAQSNQCKMPLFKFVTVNLATIIAT